MDIFKLARNSIWLLLAQVTGKAAMFVFFIVAARYLGSTDFGKYSFALTVVTLYYMVVDFGLGLLTFREVAKDARAASDFIRASLVLKMALAVLSYLSLIVFLKWLKIPEDTYRLSLLLSLTVFTYAISSTLESLFKAFERMHYILLSALFTQLGLLLGGAYLLAFGYGLSDLILLQVAINVLNALLFLLVAGRKMIRLEFGIDLSRYLGILREAFPLAALAFLGVLYFRVDIIFLEKLRGEEVVGWYNAAYKLMDSLMIFSGSIIGALFPYFSRLGGMETRPQLKNLFENTFKYFFMASLPLAILISAHSDQIVLLIYGEHYRPAVPALRILIWAIPMIYVNAVFLYTLIAAGRQRDCAIAQGICAAGNILLNISLIPHWGYLGAAISTVVSEIFTLVVFGVLVFRHLFHFDLWTVLFKTALASALMSLPLLWFDRMNLSAVLGLSGVTYLISLTSLRLIGQKEMDYLKRLFAGG